MITIPKVTLVGRVNVGKSTLFNKLIGESRALVSVVPGTTRDINIGLVAWQKKEFLLVDTGGVDFGLDDKRSLGKKSFQKTLEEIKDADLVLMVVDAQSGLVTEDRKIADLIKRKGKPIILAANKIDSGFQHEIHRFHSLNLGQPLGISSLSGVGTGNLLDQIVRRLPRRKAEEKSSRAPEIKVALIGKPNVGKSSLINAIFNQDKVIVSPEPFTTREPRDLPLYYNGHKLTFIDTVGIRKKAKSATVMEITGVKLTKRQFHKTDVILLVIEAQSPITQQDLKLASEISRSRAGIIIVVNKWDLIPEKEVDTMEAIKTTVRHYFRFISWAPVALVSALQPQKLQKLLPLIIEVNENRERALEQDILDPFIKKMVKQHLPTKGSGTRYPKIYEMKMIDVKPPTFQISVSSKTSLHPSYIKFLENQLRKIADFSGTPIVIYVKKSKIL